MNTKLRRKAEFQGRRTKWSLNTPLPPDLVPFQGTEKTEEKIKLSNSLGEKRAVWTR